MIFWFLPILFSICFHNFLLTAGVFKPELLFFFLMAPAPAYVCEFSHSGVAALDLLFTCYTLVFLFMKEILLNHFHSAARNTSLSFYLFVKGLGMKPLVTSQRVICSRHHFSSLNTLIYQEIVNRWLNFIVFSSWDFFFFRRFWFCLTWGCHTGVEKNKDLSACKGLILVGGATKC